MLNGLPRDTDIEISIVRTLGDHLTFYNYEKYKLQLFDDYLVFHEDNGKQHKILYKNITQFKWKPIARKVIDGEYKTKKGDE